MAAQDAGGEAGLFVTLTGASLAVTFCGSIAEPGAAAAAAAADRVAALSTLHKMALTTASDRTLAGTASAVAIALAGLPDDQTLLARIDPIGMLTTLTDDPAQSGPVLTFE